MHLLFVDDDLSILELLKVVIKDTTDHTLVTASNASDAFDLLARPYAKKFDCFLLDIQMPGIDGIELCRNLRNRPEYTHAPIVMLTAMSEQMYIDRAFAAGADDYITKPFDLEELQERLDFFNNRIKDRRKK